MLGMRIGLQQVCQRTHRDILGRPRKFFLQRFVHRDNKHSASALWQAEIQGVQYLPKNMVPHSTQCTDYPSKRFALSVGHKLRDIFEHKGLRLLDAGDPLHVPEQGASCVAHSLLVADDAEGLAWEARKQDIVIGNILRIYIGDVACGLEAEVALVPFGGNRIELGREQRGHSPSGRRDMEAADSAEQVDERLEGMVGSWRDRGLQPRQRVGSCRPTDGAARRTCWPKTTPARD